MFLSYHKIDIHDELSRPQRSLRVISLKVGRYYVEVLARFIKMLQKCRVQFREKNLNSFTIDSVSRQNRFYCFCHISVRIIRKPLDFFFQNLFIVHQKLSQDSTD